MKARVSDIAKRSGVSPATVSRVIHGYVNVNEETRRVVEKAILELNYKPKTLVSAKTRPNRLIALMIGDIRNPFYNEMVYYLQKEFSKYGYIVVPLSTEFNRDREKELMYLTKQQELAALILISGLESDELKKSLEYLTCPVMLLDRVIEDFPGNIVIQDNFQAGYMATKYLIDLGYHEIAFIAGNTNSASGNRRVDGYRKALSNAFLPVRDELIIPGEMSVERGYRDGIKYLNNLGKMPRAALVVNDMTAIGFLDACKERGARVPEDISVVSFDDIELSSLKSVNLTTVRQSNEKMSKKICEMTITAIRNPKNGQNSRVMLEPTLVIRGSACPNTHGK